MFNVPESDWKVLRDLKQELLDAASEEVFKQILALCDTREGRQYKVLRELHKLIGAEERRLAVMFEEMRPATALVKIMNLCKAGLIDEARFERFSAETQERVILLLHERRR